MKAKRVHESISFKRGEDPISALDVGWINNIKKDDLIRTKEDLYHYVDVKTDEDIFYTKEDEEFAGQLIDNSPNIAKGTVFIYAPAHNGFNMYDNSARRVSRIIDYYIKWESVKNHPHLFEPVINESISFKRGEDSHKSLGVGWTENIKNGDTIEVKEDIYYIWEDAHYYTYDDLDLPGLLTDEEIDEIIHGDTTTLGAPAFFEEEILQYDGEYFISVTNPKGHGLSLEWVVKHSDSFKPIQYKTNESISFKRDEDPYKALNVGYTEPYLEKDISQDNYGFDINWYLIIPERAFHNNQETDFYIAVEYPENPLKGRISLIEDEIYSNKDIEFALEVQEWFEKNKVKLFREFEKNR